MRSKKLRILNFAKQERPTPEEMGEDGEGGGEGSRMESMGFTRLSNLARAASPSLAIPRSTLPLNVLVVLTATRPVASSCCPNFDGQSKRWLPPGGGVGQRARPHGAPRQHKGEPRSSVHSKREPPPVSA